MQSPSFRVLHAEDNPDALELVSIILAQHNCEAVGAVTHDEALLRASEGGFHLYLLDMYLDGESGIDLCKKIREFDSKTPVLFFSAAAFEKDKNLAMTHGAQGYLTKPTEPGVLVKEIFRLIEQHSN